MEEVIKVHQSPCTFCIDTESPGLQCHCKLDCGLPDCAMSEKPLWYRAPVPKFGGPMPSKPKFPKAVEHEVAPMEPEDYVLAIKRIVELHQPCPCQGCKHTHQRAACLSCGDFWPCNTIRAIRGVRVPAFDSAEGIAYS